MSIRTRKRIITGACIAVGIIALLALVFLGYQVLVATRDGEREYYNEIYAENTVTVYMAAEDISAGSVISADMLMTRNTLMGERGALFTADDIGKVSLIDIPQGTVLYSVYAASDVYGDSTRLTEYSCFGLSSNMRPGNFIDVRIRFPDGEDFVVLSKKYIENMSYAASTCFLFVNDLETHYMASAIHDTIEYGAVMYAVLYVNPGTQAETIVDYIPALSIAKRIWADNINSDKEVTDAGYVYNYAERYGLEKRMAEVTGAGDISNVGASVSSDMSNGNGRGVDSISGYDETGITEGGYE